MQKVSSILGKLVVLTCSLLDSTHNSGITEVPVPINGTTQILCASNN